MREKDAGPKAAFIIPVNADHFQTNRSLTYRFYMYVKHYTCRRSVRLTAYTVADKRRS